MKKTFISFVSICIVLTLIMGTVPVYAGKVEDIGFDEKFDLLVSIGILENRDLKLSPDEAVTRAEFAKYISAFAGVTSDKSGFTGLKDVPSGSLEEAAVYAVVSNGLMKPVLKEYFYPAYAVTYHDAIDSTLRLLDYGKIIDSGMDVNRIVPKRLLDDISGKDIFTRRDVYALIYNALFQKMMNVISVSDGNINYEAGDSNALYHYFGILEEVGTVSSFDGMGISVNGKSKGRMTIDNLNLKIGNLDLELRDVLGRNVSVFWKEDTKTAVHVSNGENDILSFNSENVDYSGKIYTYEDDTRIKEAKLKNPYVFYNNSEYTGNFVQKVMLPESGYITLVDNNNDGWYDFVFIDSYEDYCVNVVNDRDGFIVDRHMGEVSLGDIDEAKIFDADNNSVDFSKIKSGTIITLLKSFDEEEVRAYVSTETITGEIETIYNDGFDTIYEVNGDEYKLSSYLEDRIADGDLSELQIGKEYVFSLNVYGKIAYVVQNDASRGNLNFGITAGVAKEGSLDSTYLMRVWSKMDGEFTNYPLAKKVVLNGKSGSTGEDVYKALCASVVNGVAEDTKPVPQLIEFGLNNKDEVNYIQQTYAKNDPDATFHMYMGSLTEKGKSRAYHNVLVQTTGGQYLWDGKPADMCGYTEKTQCIQVPYSNGKIDVSNEKLFKPKTVPHASDFEFLAFKNDPEDTCASVLILPTPSDALANCGNEFNIAMVEKISGVCVDEEARTAVTLNGKQYYTPDTMNLESLEIFDKDGKASGTKYKLKIGDLVNFASDAEGNLTALEAVYDHENKVFLGRGDTKLYESRTTEFNLHMYRLYKTENGFWVCTEDAPDDFDPETSTMYMTISKTAVFFDGEEVVSYGNGDLIGFKDSYDHYVDIIMYSRYNDPRSAYIYKN